MSKIKNKIELIVGLIFLITGIILTFTGHKSIMCLVCLVLQIVLIVFLIKNRQKHVYWEDKPLLSIYSFFYKADVYTTVIWILANYPGKTIMIFLCFILCIGYMFFAYFNGKQYKEMLNAFIYWQALAFIPHHLLQL